MKLNQLTSIEAVRQFLEGAQAVAFCVANDKQERYQWIQNTLVAFRYSSLGKADKGLLTRYLMKVTNYSHAQIKRLIQQYIKKGRLTVKVARRNGFKLKYAKADIRLLAEMDERHQQPSGPALKKFCERAWELFDELKYECLASISVWRLYNLRQSITWQRQRCLLTKTRPKAVSIGRRRKPCPNDQPGYIRIDSVHQGDQDRRKGSTSSPTKGFITSMPLMKSRSFRLLSQWSA